MNRSKQGAKSGNGTSRHFGLFILLSAVLILLISVVPFALNSNGVQAADKNAPLAAETPTEQPTEPPATSTSTSVPATATSTEVPPEVTATATTQLPPQTSTPPPQAPQPVTIPEPITVVLFGTGLAALSAGAASRRKNNNTD